MKFARLTDIGSVLPILSRIAIWGGVSDKQAGEIVRRLETGTFDAGEYVFHKGDEPSSMYIVRNGSVDLLIGDEGAYLKKKTLSVGDCFGVASLMAMQRHTTTALAVEKSEILALTRPALLELQRKDIRLFALLMMNIARELARRLKMTDDILLHYIESRGEG